MAQTGHPYSAQVKASIKRRLRKLGAHAGKSFGHSAMQAKKHYPSTNAGTEREFTISGKSAKPRADRAVGKFARGGRVKKGHHTTNIVIAQHPGPGAGAPPPGPAGMPPPAGGGGPPAAPLRAAPPPMMPPGGAGALPPPGARPPGMAYGGLAGPSYHHWGEGYKHGGHVKKAAKGGFLKDPPGHTYEGYPHSPTKGVDDAVSPTKHGGAVKKKAGGVVKKQGGGPVAPVRPAVPAQAPAGLANRPAMPVAAPIARPVAPTLPVQANPAATAALANRFAGAGVPVGPTNPNALAALAARPALPAQAMGVRPFKKGGKVHSDVAEDKKLIASELAKHEKKEMDVEGTMRHKRAKGGFVGRNQDSKDPGLTGGIHHNEGVGYRKRGGHIPQLTNAGSGSGKGRLQKSAMAAKVPARTEV